ncbi:hypothetical protein JWG42_03685 [Desulfoprunum benzoelyticum]|jgi:hypothetical protein|uniref:Histidine kinase n=1 Tax=Desulfoprunum benzoelyticum TaxID=1506996 RepID=A0A840UPP8_9BACT|nr:hypothetical protein [Desulfoprunum benzoelyticum]MBB5347615.1 hypothetical protein [Desulfoprunum benzoelyticum]MBM9529256.1 hypothetical protein [Desulfoprunum benzoelyticum]
MLYQGSTQAYYRSTVPIRIRHLLGRRRGIVLPGGVEVWKAIGKGLVVLLPVVFAIQLLFGFLVSSVEESIATTDDLHYDLMITNSLLKAERSQLLTPEQVTSVAGGSVSLSKPDKGQVLRYNRASGQFRYF